MPVLTCTTPVRVDIPLCYCSCANVRLPPGASLISDLFNGYLCRMEQGLALKLYLLGALSIC